MSKLAIEFRQGEFTHQRIHDQIIGTMKAFQKVNTTIGGANIKAKKLSKDKKGEAVREIGKLNALGKEAIIARPFEVTLKESVFNPLFIIVTDRRFS